MAQIVTIPEHGDQIIDPERRASQLLQLFFDNLVQELNANLLGEQGLVMPSYTVATLPDVPSNPSMIYVSDETGGAVPAFSDGTNWRRVTDRAIVS